MSIKYISEIKNDRILKWIIIGIFAPIIILILGIILALLGVNLGNSSNNIIYVLIYVFTISLASLIIYLPFIKKGVYRTKETKILIGIWIVLSSLVLILYSVINNISLKDFLTTPLIIYLVLIISFVFFIVGIPLFIVYVLMMRVKESSRMLVIYGLTLSIILSIASALIVYVYKPNLVKVDYPFTFSHYGNSYACEGLVIGVAQSDPDKYKISPNAKGISIEASTSTKNLDKVAIEIDGNNLKFTTQSNVQAGETQGRPMQIIENSDKYLVASDRLNVGLKPYDVFTLNKTSGVALWTENLIGFMSEDPEGFSEYLICR
jgi:hypothetical protein